VALDLSELVAAGHTALVTQECQGATMGAEAALPQLAEIAQRLAVPNIARLVRAARAAGVPVVHCVAMRRDDGQGSNHNARLFMGMLKTPVPLRPGTPAVEIVPEIGVAESDVVLSRLHGLGPMGGTDLDPVLRNLGVTTIVGVGVSVNVAIPNFVMDAVNHGYQFVLPRDAVAGIPERYADDVIDNSLSLLATVTTTDEILGAWSES
jgi:biuret amidohydrolase